MGACCSLITHWRIKWIKRLQVLVRSCADSVRDDSLNYPMNLTDYLKYASVYFSHRTLEMNKWDKVCLFTFFAFESPCNLVGGKKQQQQKNLSDSDNVWEEGESVRGGWVIIWNVICAIYKAVTDKTFEQIPIGSEGVSHAWSPEAGTCFQLKGTQQKPE